MAMSVRGGIAPVCLLAGWWVATPARGATAVDAIAGSAEIVVPASESAVGVDPPVSELVPPELLGSAEVSYPEDAPPLATAITVRVLIHIDATGEVAWVRLLSDATDPVQAPFNAALLATAAGFRFSPALHRGEPVPVEISFEQTFLPNQSYTESPEQHIVRDAVLEGHIIEKGTRERVAFASIVATVEGRDYVATSAEDGGFRLVLPAGAVRVEVLGPEHHRFVVSEKLGAREDLQVEYLTERLSYRPFETVVIGKRERRVVSRTSLRDRELRRVPGTFGDPFRVIGTLPGVSQVMSLLAYPIVRGSSPGNTGFLLDGVRVPALFHMLAGPAVIHPEIIDRVDFYPGTFPAEYGGYVGGVVDGITKRVRPGEGELLTDVSLTQAGLLLRGPIDVLDISGTVAGRFGYPFVLMEAFDVPVFLSYWDYQGRLDGDLGPGRWRVFVFGSFDELGDVKENGEPETLVRTMFHRIDMSYSLGGGEEIDTYKVVLGVDQTLAGTNQGTLTSWLVEPRLRWNRKLFAAMDLSAGIDAAYRYFDGGTSISTNIGGGFGDSETPSLQASYYQAGAFVSLPWKPRADLLIVPGARIDAYANDEATQWSVDPRLAVRYRLTEFLDGELWLKAGAGRYHQPPRFLIPIPGFEELALAEGLLASTQVSAGFEMPLLFGFNLDAQGYYQYMDPILFDLAINDDPAGVVGGLHLPNEQVTAASGSDLIAGFLDRRIGRSYGLEVLIKHDGKGRFFGWLSYTLSWSERKKEEVWTPFDFDRRHVINLVAGVSLPRNWDVGVRVQAQSGRPFTDSRGFNSGRGEPFYRIDVRFDKRAVWNDWLFDFYIDLINVTLAPEEIDARLEGPMGNAVRIPLPTIGVRGVI